MSELDLIEGFMRRYDRTLVPAYQDRDGRNRWAASYLRTLSGKTVLNLGGGGRRHLAKHLGAGWQVHELDVTGDCDTCLNLDQVERLPFADGAFDICCALEVLEHLDRLHLVAEEMFRVAKSTLLISLPNAAVEIAEILANRRYYTDPAENGVYSKFYGLPLAPPTDRHRWWLTFEDIVRYWLAYEERHACAVTFFIPNDEFSLKRKLLRRLCGERLYLTLCCSSVWVRLQKDAPSPVADTAR
jgi:SAM-dependent methyltransferase